MIKSVVHIYQCVYVHAYITYTYVYMLCMHAACMNIYMGLLKGML